MLLIAAVLLSALRWGANFAFSMEIPWTVVALLLAASGLVLHKRTQYRVAPTQNVLRRFVFVALIYLLPATTCWAASVVLISHSFAERIAAIWLQLAVIAGFWQLVFLLAINEFRALKTS